MNIKLPVITTPTRIELGQRCYRRHALADVLERGKWRSAAAEFGNVMHAGSAEWWRTLALDSALAALRAEWAVRFIPTRIPDPGKVSVELGEAMLRRYSEQARLASVFEPMGPWSVMTIEDRLEHRVGDYVLSFQVDRALYNSTTDHLVVVDLKTASRLDRRWERQWDRSLQMKLYKWAIRQVYQIDNVDIVIEGIDKSMSAKLLEVTCPEWTDAQLDEAVSEFTRIAGEDEQLLLAATYESTEGSVVIDIDKLVELAVTSTSFNYEDCYSYNYECPFLPICNADPSERVGLLKSEYIEVESDYAS